MFKDSATNLHNIPVNKGIEWLQTFDTVLSDCDGKYFRLHAKLDFVFYICRQWKCRKNNSHKQSVH